jgi:hypothetical protein
MRRGVWGSTSVPPHPPTDANQGTEVSSRLAADDRVRRGQAGAEQAGGEHDRRETEVRFMVCSGRSVG